MAWETQAVSTNETFRLENFTYSNIVIRNVIFGYLEQTNFTGVSVSEICRAQVQAPHSITYWISGWFGLLTSSYMFGLCSVSPELCVISDACTLLQHSHEYLIKAYVARSIHIHHLICNDISLFTIDHVLNTMSAVRSYQLLPVDNIVVQVLYIGVPYSPVVLMW